SKMDGGNLVTKTGVVSNVTKSGDSYTVTIDGVSFDLSKITSVSETASDTSTGISTGNQLGDMIARASLMIGMQATVSASTDSGTAIDSGIIESIQVKNGEVSAVINGIAYKLSDIVEVAYANISVGGEEESTEGVQPEGTEDIVDAANAAAQAGSDTPQEVAGGAVPDDEEAEDLEDLEFDDLDEV
ncbi:MAG: hypothetical protein ACI4Q4_03745, partial [Oscillospiraceae bacterium]